MAWKKGEYWLVISHGSYLLKEILLMEKIKAEYDSFSLGFLLPKNPEKKNNIPRKKR